MNTLILIGRLIVMASVLVYPQLLGVLLFLRIRRLKLLATIVGVLAPPILFFFLSPIYLFAGIREAQAKGELTCGMPALGALMLVFIGTALEFFFALILHSAWRRIRATDSTA